MLDYDVLVDLLRQLRDDQRRCVVPSPHAFILCQRVAKLSLAVLDLIDGLVVDHHRNLLD